MRESQGVTQDIVCACAHPSSRLISSYSINLEGLTKIGANADIAYEENELNSNNIYFCLFKLRQLKTVCDVVRDIAVSLERV